MADFWVHAGSAGLTAFLASLVECVEALTIVLAVGPRDWRAALTGCSTAFVLLAALAIISGPALAQVPLDVIQLVVGGLLLLFGLRWLRKAVLRQAGVLPLHDETETFRKETSRLAGLTSSGWDKIAFATSFQITMLEGAEVVFIVSGIGAGDAERLGIAGIGALLAMALVIALGVIVHRPLANVPENRLKLVVGILLSAFGTFWFGEGAGFIWPGADWSLLWLLIGYTVVALTAVRACQAVRRHADRPNIWNHV